MISLKEEGGQTGSDPVLGESCGEEKRTRSTLWGSSHAEAENVLVGKGKGRKHEVDKEGHSGRKLKEDRHRGGEITR